MQVEGRAAGIGLGDDVVDRGRRVALVFEGDKRPGDQAVTGEALLFIAQGQPPLLCSVFGAIGATTIHGPVTVPSR